MIDYPALETARTLGRLAEAILCAGFSLEDLARFLSEEERLAAKDKTPLLRRLRLMQEGLLSSALISNADITIPQEPDAYAYDNRMIDDGHAGEPIKTNLTRIRTNYIGMAMAPVTTLEESIRLIREPNALNGLKPANAFLFAWLMEHREMLPVALEGKAYNKMRYYVFGDFPIEHDNGVGGTFKSYPYFAIGKDKDPNSPKAWDHGDFDVRLKDDTDFADYYLVMIQT